MGVIDPLGGAVPVSRLARAGKRWDDLIVVLTAEQLGLTGVQGNPWNKQKPQVSGATVLGMPVSHACLLGTAPRWEQKRGGNTAVPQRRAPRSPLTLPGMWLPGLRTLPPEHLTAHSCLPGPTCLVLQRLWLGAPQSSLFCSAGSFKNTHYTMSCVLSTQAPRPGLQSRTPADDTRY